jgi:hypothetical protein
MDSVAEVAVTPIPFANPKASRAILNEVARLGLSEQFPEVVELTREIFGDFEIVISEDPEIPNCSYVSFDVRVPGSVDEAMEKSDRWYQGLPAVPAQAPGAFCLGIRRTV